MIRVLVIFATLMLMAGCSRFRSSAKDNGEVVTNSPKSDLVSEKGSIEDERELKVAKLWSRVDELEEEVFRQKERMKLLEKGLLTGIAPDDLNKKKEAKTEIALPEPQELVAEEPATKNSGQGSNPNEMSMEEQDHYAKQLEIARGLYTSARYGKAIIEYERILSNFGEKVDSGFIKYWIGSSWRQLKEYTTAEEILNSVLEKHPSSPWIPRVHYELAKVYIDANNLSAAREKLKFIKNKYQYEDVSELATRELEELPKKL